MMRSSCPLPKTIDWRLRVMMRFADFCMDVIQRLRRPVNGDAGFGGGLGPGIDALSAATRISMSVLVLLQYIGNPRALAPLRRILSASRTSSQGVLPRKTSRAKRGPGNAQSESLAENLAENLPTNLPTNLATNLAGRIAHKVADMIRRDQLFRFGPRLVLDAPAHLVLDAPAHLVLGAPARLVLDAPTVSKPVQPAIEIAHEQIAITALPVYKPARRTMLLSSSAASGIGLKLMPELALPP